MFALLAFVYKREKKKRAALGTSNLFSFVKVVLNLKNVIQLE